MMEAERRIGRGLSAAGGVSPDARPRFCGRFLVPAWGSHFWSEQAGIGALAIPCCRVARRSSKRLDVESSEGRRYVDFAIRELAQRFDAFGVRREESRGEAFRRRRCFAGLPSRGHGQLSVN